MAWHDVPKDVAASLERQAMAAQPRSPNFQIRDEIIARLRVLRPVLESEGDNGRTESGRSTIPP